MYCAHSKFIGGNPTRAYRQSHRLSYIYTISFRILTEIADQRLGRLLKIAKESRRSRI